MSEVEVIEVPKIGGPPPIPPALIAATAAAAKAAGIDTGPVPGEREEKFDTDEGVVLIRFPEELSADSVQELDEFLKLFIKKAKRRAGVQ